MNARFKKFFSYYRPYRGLFTADLLSSCLTAIIALAIPLCVRHITKEILENPTADALSAIYRTGALMLVLVLAKMFFTYVQDYYGHAMGAMMETDMREELFRHYQKLPFRFYDDQKPGQLMSRLTNDLLSLAELYHHAPENLVIYLTKFVGAAIALTLTNASLSLIVLAFIPVMAVFVLKVGLKLNGVYTANYERISEVNSQVEENLSGIRTVQSFAAEGAEIEKFGHINRRFLDSRKSIYWHESILSFGTIALTEMITIAVAVFGGKFILGGTLGLADLITFLLYVGYLVEPIPSLAFMVKQYEEGIAGFNRFLDIVEMDPEIKDAENAVGLPAVQGKIDFKDVSFRYNDSGEYVLKNLNLSISPGEYVALVGYSGVGKTTLCSLIPRFYDVTGGSIFIDGHDIRSVTLASLRQNIGIVAQDIYLFPGTVAENIRYSLPNASMDAVIAAAKKANAHNFIMSLPKGYDTDIGHRGIKLSGGQKQRISIARVFLKNPPILILDEATSSLDNESEQVIRDSLEALLADRTTLVIAHRLSTIRNAGRILVLSDQGIVEQGTHEELIARGGTYRQLYNAQ